MKYTCQLITSVLLCLIYQNVQAVDTAAPVLTSISVSPASVDAAGGDQMITVTLTVTDDESGLLFGNIFLYDFADNFIDAIYFNPAPPYLTSGTATNGTYSVPATVPQYAAGGTFEVRVLLRDNESQDRRYGGTHEPFPTPGDEDFLVVNAGPVDTSAPQIAALSVTPGTIDTATVSQVVTVQLNITDDLTGFDYASVEVYDPSGTYRDDLTGFFTAPEAYSGDPLDGLYEVPITIPAGSLNGTWTLEFFIRDRLANYDYLSGLTGAEFIVSNGGGGASGDLSDAIDATQYSYFPYGDANWFFQTATTYDGIDAAQSGAIPDDGYTGMEISLEGPGTLTFWWKVDSEDGFDFLSVEGPYSFYDEITGNVDWTEVTIPIPAGPQTVAWTYYKDSSSSEGSDAGWVDRVYYATEADVEEPVLQYINISPSPVDISTGDQTVTITLEISDDYNGINDGGVLLYDPADNQYDYIYFSSGDLVSGDGNFGTYQVMTTLYQSDFIPVDYYGLGTWRADVEIGEDVTFNYTYYGMYDNPFPNPGDELFTVADGVGGDSQGPYLVSIDPISPVSGDFSAGGQIQTVTFEVTDNASGLGYGYLYLYSPTGGFVDATFFDGSNLTGGDLLDGTYSVDVMIPQYAPSGTWSLDFSLTDNAENVRDYPFNTPFPNPGDEAFLVTNTGASDTSDPVLQSIVVSPSAIDTSASAQSIDVTLTISEDLSGLDAVNLYVYDPSNNYISSLYTYFPGDDQLGGVFSTTLEIPQGSAEGTWTFATIIRDNVGNSARHGIYWDSFPVPGDEEFTVGAVSPSTFDNFVSLYSLTGDDALLGGNPDGDWLINALELVLGTNPTAWDAINPSLLAVEIVGSELRMTFTIDADLTIGTSGDFLQLSDGGGGAPLNLTGQTASLLDGSWLNVLPSLLSGTTYRVSLTISPGGRGFMQLDLN